MKKAFSEIKKLTKAKSKKPKRIDITEYLNQIMLCCDTIIKDENSFKLFCQKEKVSPKIARKMQEFADTKSFLNYIANHVLAIITNPKQKLLIPTKEDVKVESENFAVVILKNLAENLKTQSVETMQAFLKAAKESMTPELIEEFGNIPI